MPNKKISHMIFKSKSDALKNGFQTAENIFWKFAKKQNELADLGGELKELICDDGNKIGLFLCKKFKNRNDRNTIILLPNPLEVGSPVKIGSAGYKPMFLMNQIDKAFDEAIKHLQLKKNLWGLC